MPIAADDVFALELGAWNTALDPADVLFSLDALDEIADKGGTFTRASVATYVDRNGVVQAAGVNEDRGGARAHYISGLATRLLEDTRQNVCLQSEDFGTTWTVIAATIAANATTAPDGTATADKIQEDTATSAHGVTQSITCGNATYTFSVFVKAAERTKCVVNIADNSTGEASIGVDLATGATFADGRPVGSWTAISALVEALDGVNVGWYRVSVTGTRGAGTVCEARVFAWTSAFSYAGTAGSGVYAWGAQLEVGPARSSYIKTTTVAVTRSADSLTFPHTDLPQTSTWYADFVEQGTLLVGGNSGLLGIGAAVNPALFIFNNAGKYGLFHRRAADVSSTAATGPTIGQRVTLRGLLASTGSVQLGQSIAGATEVVASASAANALAGAWNNTTLTLNDPGLGTKGFVAFARIVIAAGTKTLDTIPMERLVLLAGNSAPIVTSATDNPPNASFFPRIGAPSVMLARTAFADRATSGQSNPSAGEISLENPETTTNLDYLKAYAFDGRTAVMCRGQVGAAYPSAWTKVLDATMDPPLWSVDGIKIRVRDNQKYASVPIQTNLYLGTNVDGEGLEGTADDLKGKPKPLAFGNLTDANLTPDLVNAQKLIYKVNDGAISDVPVVKDRGIPLTNRLFLIGGGARIYYSTDAATWTVAVQTVFAGSNKTRAFAFGAGVFVAVGGLAFTASIIGTSPDGKTWTSRTSPFGTNEIRAVAWNGTVFCAGDDTGQIATSPDGVTWTLRTSGIASIIKNIVWNGTVFIAEAGGILRTSPDGITWTTRTSQFGATITYGLVYASEISLSVLVGDAGKISTSADGLTWTAVTPVDATATYVDVAYGNGRLVAIDINTGNTITSLAGAIWVAGGSVGIHTLAQGQGLRFGNGTFVLVGSGGYAVTSRDGIAWSVASEAVVFTSIALWGVTFADLAALTTYANATELQDDSMAPPPGLYRVCPSTGEFRLGSPPVGQITCGVVQGATAADRTHGQVFRQLLARAGRVPLASDITTLDTANPAEIGLFISSDEHKALVGEKAGKVADSAGCWWGGNGDGVLRIRQLVDPAGETPVATFLQNDMDPALQPIASGDANGGIPPYEVHLRYAENLTVQTSDLAGGVSDAERTRLGQQWRVATAADPDVLTIHPFSQPLVRDTLYAFEADAQDEADRLLALLGHGGVQRSFFECGFLTTAALAALELGDTVEVVHQRWGLSAGVNMTILGIKPVAHVGSNNSFIHFTLFR